MVLFLWYNLSGDSMKKKYLLLMFVGVILVLLSLIIKGDDLRKTKLDEHIKDQYTEEINKELDDEFYIEIDFDGIKEINEDVIGWIKIPNTKVDYPILQGKDNEFYLDRNINKEKSRHGSIFMDYRNVSDGSDRHTIIYGHQTSDGSMFTSLNKFKDESFLKNNNVFKIKLINNTYTYEIFSAYVTDTSFYYIMTNFRSDESFVSYINQLKNKSYFNSDIILSEDDKVLTLSTCSYEFDNARFVIHARMIN